MPYIRKLIIAGRTILFQEHWAGRYEKKGQKEVPREKSSESVKLSNERKQIRELTAIMNANFIPDRDQHFVMEWKKEEKPKDYQTMLRDAQKFIRRLRKEYRKQGKILRYIYSFGWGDGKKKYEPGGPHIHIVLNDADSRDVRKWWGHGYTWAEPLKGNKDLPYPNGNYEGLAKYFLKNAEEVEHHFDEKLGRRWKCSLNLERPQPRIRKISKRSFDRGFPEWKDYEIDRESIREGIDGGGLPYRECIYTLQEETPTPKSRMPETKEKKCRRSRSRSTREKVKKGRDTSGT